MINGKRVLAIIPARKGSKGIINKNIVDLKGMPLISYTINSAKKSKYIDNTVVSTDGEEIASIAEKYGANIPFYRPENLSLDNSNVITAVNFTVSKFKEKGVNYDIIILLQPTSPFRNEIHIDEALEMLIEKNLPSILSVCEVEKNPTLIRELEKDNKITPLVKSDLSLRQEMNKYYILNGAIYINYTEDIENGKFFKDNEYGYVMDKYHSLDIDDILDLKTAEFYIENKFV